MKSMGCFIIAPESAMTATLQNPQHFLIIFKQLLIILPAILFLVIYSNEIKRNVLASQRLRIF